jgi:uncharacterized surface protein with fasciclin (FAS1) repeats
MSRAVLVVSAAFTLGLAACNRGDTPPATTDAPAAGASAGQALVDDTTSVPNVVRVAVKSPDHTTLVKALQAANLVDPLANPGPFTVFAPTNAAFDKLPPGALASLMEPANKSPLTAVLHPHVTTSALDLESLADGQELGMVAGGSERISRKDGNTYIGSARIVASVRASNGWVHVIDGVLLPPQ